jgi:hypothetical protein
MTDQQTRITSPLQTISHQQSDYNDAGDKASMLAVEDLFQNQVNAADSMDDKKDEWMPSLVSR